MTVKKPSADVPASRAIVPVVLPPEPLPGSLVGPIAGGDVRMVLAGRGPAESYLARLTSEESVRAMRGSLTVLAKLAGYPATVDPLGLPWATLDYDRALSLRGELVRRYAPRTASRHLACLRGVLREAWRLGLIDRERLERVIDLAPIKGSREARGRALTPDEVGLLLQASDPRSGAAIVLAAFAGMRRAEIVALWLNGYDPEGTGRLRVIGKGNKERLIPLPPGAQSWLDRWLAVRSAEPGFLICEGDRHGHWYPAKGLSEQSIYRIFQEAAKKAGVKLFAPHDLRRTYVTTLLENGADVISVSKLAGHANIQTTLLYDRRGEKARVQAVTVLAVPTLNKEK